MKRELLEKLRCPKTGKSLRLENLESAAGADSIENGWLVVDDSGQRYQILNGIPRFVSKENYADNFGMQWNYFRQIQLDILKI